MDRRPDFSIGGRGLGGTSAAVATNPPGYVGSNAFPSVHPLAIPARPHTAIQRPPPETRTPRRLKSVSLQGSPHSPVSGLAKLQQLEKVFSEQDKIEVRSSRATTRGPTMAELMGKKPKKAKKKVTSESDAVSMGTKSTLAPGSHPVRSSTSSLRSARVSRSPLRRSTTTVKTSKSFGVPTKKKKRRRKPKPPPTDEEPLFVRPTELKRPESLRDLHRFDPGEPHPMVCYNTIAAHSSTVSVLHAAVVRRPLVIAQPPEVVTTKETPEQKAERLAAEAHAARTKKLEDLKLQILRENHKDPAPTAPPLGVTLQTTPTPRGPQEDEGTTALPKWLTEPTVDLSWSGPVTDVWCLFTGGDDKTIKIFSRDFVCTDRLIAHSGPVKALLAHGHLLFSGSADCTIRVWDLTTNTTVHTFVGHRHGVTNIVLSGGTELMLSSDYGGHVKIWPLATLQCTHTVAHHSNTIWRMALHADSGRLFTVSSDRMLKVVALSDLRALPPDRSPDTSTSLLTTTSNKSTAANNNANRSRNVDLRSIKAALGARGDEDEDDENRRALCLARLPVTVLQRHSGAVTSFAFDPVRNLLITGSHDATLGVWGIVTSAVSLKFIQQLYGHLGPISEVVVFRNSLFSCAADLTIRIWSLAALRCVHTLHVGGSQPPRRLLFVLDECTPSKSTLVAGAGDGSLFLWSSEIEAQRAAPPVLRSISTSSRGLTSPGSPRRVPNSPRLY